MSEKVPQFPRKMSPEREAEIKKANAEGIAAGVTFDAPKKQAVPEKPAPEEPFTTAMMETLRRASDRADEIMTATLAIDADDANHEMYRILTQLQRLDIAHALLEAKDEEVRHDPLHFRALALAFHHYQDA